VVGGGKGRDEKEEEGNERSHDTIMEDWQDFRKMAFGWRIKGRVPRLIQRLVARKRSCGMLKDA
jgi:hypothetical protein